MLPPLMISLSDQVGKPRYQTTIHQVKNGYRVEVQLILNEQPPLSQEEAQRKFGQFIREAHQKAQGSGDVLLDKVLNKAQDEEKEQERDILGERVFYTMKEVLAFLTFVYEEEEKEAGKTDGKTTGKGGKKK